jgi:predicted nucleic acid-binding protein
LKKSVLDSFAVLAFLFEEAGHQTVIALLETAASEDDVVYVAAPNWAEVRYIVERRNGRDEWLKARTSLLALPIEVRPASQTLAELAGEIKATKKMSLADCFAAALAMDLKAQLYTGDPEFHEVEENVEIVWLK